jgi:hypothetical protein|tara:strand:+ start:106 stop:612 length:507 start_codon:yes stop_codon:yes gene_type:complete
MARSDSFFIRADVTETAVDTYFQSSIDLGAYVDALGKSVLRIHNIAVSFTDGNGRSPDMGAASAGAAQFQLVTQSQGDIVLPSNRAIISSGLVNSYAPYAGVASSTSESFDNVPQLWTNGYLIAVDQIFLGVSASTAFTDDVTCSVVMECTVETMTQAAAMALALSQQ